jgi:hypothetical protein
MQPREGDASALDLPNLPGELEAHDPARFNSLALGTRQDVLAADEYLAHRCAREAQEQDLLFVREVRDDLLLLTREMVVLPEPGPTSTSIGPGSSRTACPWHRADLRCCIGCCTSLPSDNERRFRSTPKPSLIRAFTVGLGPVRRGGVRVDPSGLGG